MLTQAILSIFNLLILDLSLTQPDDKISDIWVDVDPPQWDERLIEYPPNPPSLLSSWKSRQSKEAVHSGTTKPPSSFSRLDWLLSWTGLLLHLSIYRSIDHPQIIYRLSSVHSGTTRPTVIFPWIIIWILACSIKNREIQNSENMLHRVSWKQLEK